MGPSGAKQGQMVPNGAKQGQTWPKMAKKCFMGPNMAKRANRVKQGQMGSYGADLHARISL